MIKFHPFFALPASALVLWGSAADAQVTKGFEDSTSPWLGFMNVSELPANGGAFVFGSPWGVADLVATFDDGAQTVELTPNTIGDPNEFWYQNTTGTAADPANPGGPGQLGNKQMEANLYLESTDGSLAGEELTFEVNVSAFDLAPSHQAFIYIADFVSDFSSAVQTLVPITGTGNISVTQTLSGDATNNVQWGFQVVGENVWVTDVDPFGGVTIGAATVDTGLEGDYDGNGFVSQADLDLVLLNWGDSSLPSGFEEGNIPGGAPFDALISQNELDGVLLNWGNGTPPAPAIAAVPEPATAALAGLGGLLLLGRRRSR